MYINFVTVTRVVKLLIISFNPSFFPFNIMHMSLTFIMYIFMLLHSVNHILKCYKC